jgi:1-aminocyclopropane-1-carboxylate deaminase/D-cysteine desulfhydrase-like pyridoxal-dependent ACC family enzyme
MLTAAAAKKMGMTPILILKKRGVTARMGNQLLEHLMDTDVRFMDTDSYDDIYEQKPPIWVVFCYSNISLSLNWRA